jgi:hypothetical protein
MSLDLIFPGKETAMAVRGLEDQWIIAGPIRAAIHLTGVWWTLEPKRFVKEAANAYTMEGRKAFGPHYKDADWVRWACESDRNYSWLYFYAQDMCEEYVRRFPHVARHGIYKMLNQLEDMPASLPEGPWTDPTFAHGVPFKD